MMRYFTLLYQVSKMVGVSKNENVDLFIEKALNEEFSPSEQTLQKIIAFSNAYCYAKSEAIGDLENVLN